MAAVEKVMRAVAVALTAATVSAQATPDFSGRWVLVPEPPSAAPRGSSGPAGVPGTGWGPDITITQDAGTLAVEFARFARSDMQPPVKLVYRLDGAETRNSINMGRGPQEQASKARWDAGRLEITTVHHFEIASSRDAAKTTAGARTPMASMTSETRHVLWLEPAGVLAIETTHGGALGGQPLTTKTLYKKN